MKSLNFLLKPPAAMTSLRFWIPTRTISQKTKVGLFNPSSSIKINKDFWDSCLCGTVKPSQHWLKGFSTTCQRRSLSRCSLVTSNRNSWCTQKREQGADGSLSDQGLYGFVSQLQSWGFMLQVWKKKEELRSFQSAVFSQQSLTLTCYNFSQQGLPIIALHYFCVLCYQVIFHLNQPPV